MVQNSRYGHREMEGVTCLGRGSVCSVRVPASQTWKGEEKSLLSRWVVNAMNAGFMLECWLTPATFPVKGEGKSTLGSA